MKKICGKTQYFSLKNETSYFHCCGCPRNSGFLAKTQYKKAPRGQVASLLAQNFFQATSTLGLNRNFSAKKYRYFGFKFLFITMAQIGDNIAAIGDNIAASDEQSKNGEYSKIF